MRICCDFSMSCPAKSAFRPCAVADASGPGILCDVGRLVFIPLKMEADSLVVSS